MVVGLVTGTVVDGTVVVEVVVEVVDEVIDSHNDRLLIVRCPGAQQVSVEYWRNVKMSPSSTGTESEPVALFCCVSKVYTPLMPYCGGSYTQPSLVWYAQVKSIVSTSAGIVVSIFTQCA